MKMHIYHDKEGDYVEVCFGKPAPAYFENLKGDVFQRKDEKTGAVRGFAIFNVSRHKPEDITVELPAL